MLKDMDSDSLIEYLNKINKDEFINLHREELTELYLNIIKRKEKVPVPPDMIIKCNDYENVNLEITLNEFKILLESNFKLGALG